MLQIFNLITWICSWLLLPRAASYVPGIHETGLTCGVSQTPGSRSSSAFNFMAITDAVSFQVKEQGWGAQTLMGSGPPMYALAQCRRDLRPNECYMCFTQARQVLSRCLPMTGGRIYLDGCFLRYDNYSFFHESVDPTHDINVCPAAAAGSVGRDGASRVAAVLLNVTKRAAERGFAVAEGKGVFALAQCWATLDKGECERCLSEAGNKVQQCVPAAEGMSLFTGCFLRYSTRKFYNVTESSTYSKAIVGFLLIIFVAFLCWKRIGSSKKVSDSCGPSPDFGYGAGFSFRYDLLEKGTNYFDSANKLGKDGAGSVYKGTLPPGRTVVVKRLFCNTREWTEGFFKEVNLISGIQHKNVVKLLGCSTEGPESLLVYEFVPNGSLDQVLFGKDSKNALNWEKRFQIIRGVADGLAYLHEGSGTKIIHRDIKSSNILLDEKHIPKIVDFGFAHSVTGNKSHPSTGKAETLGCMAPEYVIKGQMTERIDIYAFGVLVVEIICGKKNTDFVPGSASVLHSIWKNYKANNITASVDPALNGKFAIEEASNALQVSLLCTQSSVTLRPSMSEVVQMLTKKGYAIPSPKQQPFLNFSAVNQDDCVTYTTSILSSNGHASGRSSFHSTTSSPVDD